MATYPVPIAAHQAGKPPFLLDASPAGISAFLRSARLYFRQKKVDTDEDKISYLGEGLAAFPELYNWFNASADAHEAKTYKTFTSDLQKKALPRDYIWEAKGRIRWAKQDNRDYEEWSTALRTEQLALTEVVMPTKDFVECLLYGMDPELSVVLRNGNVLKNSGFHQDDMANLAFPSTVPTIYAATVDYATFDVEARNEWAKIASRREANAVTLKSYSKKSSSTPSSTAPPRSNSAPQGTTNDYKKPSVENAIMTGQTAKLTELEKDWLSATQGCFKCRQLWFNHSAADCRTWPTPDYVVPVPSGWDRTKEVPTTASSSTTVDVKPVTGFRALHIYDGDSDLDLPESLAQGTDTDDEGCVLPPLSFLVGSKHRGCLADALADSGSGLSLISDKLASELGLVRQKLSRPKLYRLAIQGGEEVKTLTDFVRVPLQLANGTWAAGETTLIVAPLEPPFDLILGTPFLRQHRISIALYPDPSLLIEQLSPLEPIDLYAEASGAMSQLEAMERMGEEERDEIIGTAVEQLVASVNARTEEEREMTERAARIMNDYADLFPSVLPALTADYLLKMKTRHKIKFVDTARVHNQRGFNVPRKWREKWKCMLDEQIAAGRLRPSTSPFASAAFVIPKKDPEADPRWVNDYRGLNSNTVKDRTPLPIPDEILADAALAKYWGKIDMTHAFFQTPMDEEDIAKTAIKTPWEFLGHIISCDGIEAEPGKVEKIKNWSRPRTVTQLTPLTRKGLTRIDHLWTEKEERAFEAIKKIVTSLPVLRPVDQDSDEPIWLITDASKVGVGAVLLQGKDWKTAHPCGFYSRQYIAAEKNYPTHEQELLAVITALKAWRIDLLGVRFRVLTDHDTLRHFQTQSTLSKRQARWTEVLADYDYELSYVPGKMNAVSDAMSRFSFPDSGAEVAVLQNMDLSPAFKLRDGLLYYEDSRIVVPQVKSVRETLLHDAHDTLGHLGPKKTLAGLSASFYWPGMSKAGQLNSLPVPPQFGVNAAVNESTGKTPFDLVLGFTPSIIPVPSSPPSTLPAVEALLSERSTVIQDTRDALAAAKVRQAAQANKKRGPELEFERGDLVMVDSSDRRSRYKARGGDVRAARLFPRWDGPYAVEEAFPATSTYRLSLPADNRAHPTFHSSKLKRYLPNDAPEFADREPPRPEALDVKGEKEYVVEKIVDEKGSGRGRKFLVKWDGYPDSENTWEPFVHVEDTAALDAWEVGEEV
ncbi:hypothetical protein JCM11641_006458 [Rhodosporidiobolus odoratus]